MIKGAIGILGLGVVMWAGGCGTHSGIGALGMGGEGMGTGGAIVGLGGQGFTGMGGDLGIGGQFLTGMGGDLGIGGEFLKATGGQPGHCAGGVAPLAPAKSLAFAAPAEYDTGAGAFAVTTGDLNGDGKLDLLLLDSPAGIRIMFNKGDGTFSGPADLGFGGASRLAVGDIDGDGKADIVELSFIGVSVILNKGNGSFAPPVNYVVGYGSVALALGDLNGDGKLDIAVADQGNSSDTGVGDVGILQNTGGGTFVAANYPASRMPTAIAIGDLNNDCQPDLAVVGADGVAVLTSAFGPGQGQFSSPRIFGYGTSGTSVAVADLNGDGQLDIIEGYDGGSNVLINHGDASFNAPIVYPATCTSSGLFAAAPGQPLALADMNGDGRPDVLSLASYCGGLGVFPNHGDGTFAASINVSTAPPSPAWIATGDLNGDGQVDVAVVSNDSGTSRLRVLINASH